MHEVVKIADVEADLTGKVDEATLGVFAADRLRSAVDQVQRQSPVLQFEEFFRHERIAPFPCDNRRLGGLGDENDLVAAVAMQSKQFPEIWLVHRLNEVF